MGQTFRNKILILAAESFEELGAPYDRLGTLLVDVKEELTNATFENEEEQIEGVMEEGSDVPVADENFIPLPETNEEIFQSESSNILGETIQPTQNLVCYICHKSIETLPVSCKYCPNASHYQCCDKSTILRGKDSMICDKCSSVEIEGPPNFYSLIIRSKNGNITPINNMNQLEGLSIETYKIKCPKCSEMVSLKDLHTHTGRKFELDNFNEYPFVSFADENNRAEISRVLIVFNVSKKNLIHICKRYEKRIGVVEINDMYLNASYGNFSMHKAIFITLESEKHSFMLATLLNTNLIRKNGMNISVHPVIYFWKSKAVQIDIASKHEIDLVVPQILDDFIERKWEVTNSTIKANSKAFYVVLNDISHCFSLLNSVHGLILDSKLIAKVKAIQNPSTDKKFVLILNLSNASIDDFKDFIYLETSTFAFDWDVMVEEDECQILDENSMLIKFASEQIAKAFVTDFNDILFNNHHLQMFN